MHLYPHHTRPCRSGLMTRKTRNASETGIALARDRWHGSVVGSEACGFTRRHFPAITLRVSGLGCDTEFRPSGKIHGAFRTYPDSVSFARRANFRVAGEAENRRLMAVRVTAAEHHSSPLALAPTSIARQGDSASPAFLRFQCLNQSVRYG